MSRPLSFDEVVPFDLYFGLLASANLANGSKMSANGCAALALEMITVRRTLIASPTIPEAQDND